MRAEQCTSSITITKMLTEEGRAKAVLRTGCGENVMNVRLGRNAQTIWIFHNPEEVKDLAIICTNS